MFRIILVAIYSLLCGSFILHSEIEITSTISDTLCSIGDKIHLNYSIKYDSNLKFIEPQILENIGGVEVLNFSYDSIQAFHKRLDITLIPFDTGEFLLPSLLFIFEDTIAEKIYTKRSDSYTLIVDATHLDNSELEEINVKKLPVHSINYFVILAIILPLLLIIIAFFIIRIKKSTTNR